MDKKDPRLFQFPQVYKVEASAGSGKTYALAKRYIQLLINPKLKPQEIPINAILAITFTNKAAIEMKERILEFLKKIALDKFKDPEEKEDILSSLGVSPQSARAKAAMIMDVLIRNYNFFGVQTIDSFINAILSGCAFKLDLSAGFKTKKYYGDYLSYSLDNLIDQAAEDEAVLRLFHNFLIHYLFIENKTGWFPKNDILEIITGLYSESNKCAGRFVPGDIEPKDMFLRKKEILKLLNDLNKNLPEGTNKNFVNSLSAFVERNKDTFDIDDIPKSFKNSGFPINKGHAVPKEAERLWGRIRKDAGRLCEMESASAFNYYIDIFNKVLLGLKTISAKDDVLFLEALNKQARTLFDEESEKFTQLPELYCRLAVRFKHFLIDEFQDTSILQWKNLFLMVENVLSTDGSLFYVGDRKQAIYRFRGGEVALIDSVTERFKAFNLIPETLTKNYRSQKEIVEFNNMVFSRENIRRFLKAKDEMEKGLELNPADVEGIVNVFKDSKQTHREDKAFGYVKSEFLDYKDAEETEAALKNKLPELVEDLKKRFRLKDIAILARKNDDVELLTSWLLEKGIPAESEKTLNIRQNSYIKELVSFLKFLNSPIDNLSFASFILGDMFSLASGMDNKKIRDFIFSLRDRPEESVHLYREFRARFPKEWNEFIEEFFKSVGFVPLYELTISIFARLGVMKNFRDYQGFFMKFLELIKEQEQENSSISGFLEFFDKAPEEDLYVNVTESDSVKILTIHKSKGLEFGVVILPFLEINVKPSAETLVEVNGNLHIWHLKKKYAEFSPVLEKLSREEYVKSFIDELCSIYVAFTRAADELYIFMSPKTGKGFNLATLLLPDKNLQLGKKIAYKKDKTRQAIAQIPASEYKDWIGALKDEFIDEGILLARDKILRGKVLHYILSFVGNTSGKNKASLLKQALEKASVEFPFIDNLKEYQNLVNDLLEKKGLMRFFEIPDATVYPEKEVVNLYGDTKRIDRLIVKSNEAWVVDYKSTKDEPEKYHEQVSGYVKIVRSIYPELNVKGFLIYLDSLSAEEVNG